MLALALNAQGPKSGSPAVPADEGWVWCGDSDMWVGNCSEGDVCAGLFFKPDERQIKEKKSYMICGTIYSSIVLVYLVMPSHIRSFDQSGCVARQIA